VELQPHIRHSGPGVAEYIKVTQPTTVARKRFEHLHKVHWCICLSIGRQWTADFFSTLGNDSHTYTDEEEAFALYFLILQQ